MLLVPDAARRHRWRSPVSASVRASCRSGTRPGLPSGCRRAATGWRRIFRAAEATADCSRLRLRSVSLRALSPAPSPSACATLETPDECGSCATSRSPSRRSPGRAIGSTRRQRIWDPRNSPPPCARVADRHRRQYREWVGEELLTANFPPFTRSGARAPRRRA